MAVYITKFDPSKVQLALQLYVPCERSTLREWINRFPEKENQGPVKPKLGGDPFRVMAPVFVHIAKDFMELSRQNNSSSPTTNSNSTFQSIR